MRDRHQDVWLITVRVKFTLSGESVETENYKREKIIEIYYVVVVVVRNASMDRCLISSSPHPDFSTESVLFMLVLSFSVSDSDFE